MKKIIVVIAVTLLVLSCKSETNKKEIKEINAKTTQKDKMPKKKVLSPHETAMSMVGGAHIHIDYSSPGVRNRIIFGGLLAYGQVWQAGAHNATWLETNKDLVIDGKTLLAGKYGFFAIPSKKEWTIIFNTNWNQHGKDEYDQKEDVIRFKVTPSVSDAITEHLKYEVSKISETEGTISLAWEKVSVDFKFIVK